MFYTLYLYYVEQFSHLNILRYITFRGACAFFMAFCMTLILTPYCTTFLQKLRCKQAIHNAVDTHKAKEGTPTMGGIVILVSVTCCTLLWTNLAESFIWYTLAIFLSFGAIGFYDDFVKITNRKNAGISARMKFLLQSIVSCCVMYFLVQHEAFSTAISFPFLKNITPDIGLAYVVFGALLLTASSNAVNLTDGQDGLAAGSTAIAATSLTLFLYVAGNGIVANYLQIPYIPGVGEVAIIATALVGSTMGFLWYNTYPATIFMGDVGSLSIGGLLGFFAILAKQEILLIILGGLFVIETLSVIIQVGYFKASKGKRIFLMAPLHHHFERKGLPESKIIIRFWILSIIFSLIALTALKIR